MTSTSTKIRSHAVSTKRFLNPIRIALHLWQYRYLIFQFTWREVVGRYKGSFLGIGWSFIHPLMMLAVYTFVFSVVFKAKWGISVGESRTAFALTLFMGIITFNLLGETVNLSATVILANANYVKKVVFPLEILPLVKFLGVLVNNLFSLSVLLFGLLVFNQSIPWTALLLPVVWFPIMLLSLGCGYFLASLGVFIRDVSATIGILTTILFFLTPILYPVRAVPERYRFFSRINPLALFVEDSRRVVLWGILPDWTYFFYGLVFSLVVFVFGFVWFMKSKKAFADVI